MTRDGIFGDSSCFEKRYIPDYDRLKEVLDSCRRIGYKVVLTQGVYDMPHEAHQLYLEKARSFGDILLVGVDSDELTRRRKGPNRPVYKQNERLRLLSHSRHVDILTLRDVDRKLEALVEIVHPEVLVLSESTSDVNAEHHEYLRQHCEKLEILKPMAPTDETSASARIRDILLSGIDDTRVTINKALDEFEVRLRGSVK